MKKGTELKCVATLYKGVVYIISAPAEHKDVLDYIEHTLNEKMDGTQINGFLTNMDEFVTMQEGIQIATLSGKNKLIV